MPTPRDTILSLGYVFKVVQGWAVMETCVFNGCSRHLHVHEATGGYQCFVCGECGSYKNLLEFIGNDSYTYSQPVEDKRYVKYIPETKFPGNETILKQHQDLLDNEEQQQRLMSRKGITLEAIKYFKIGIAGTDIYTIPTYIGQTPTQVNYFSYAKEEKDFWRMEGTMLNPFNINCVDKDTKELYIAEGHWDAITLWILGIHNVISPPNGISNSKWLDEHRNIFSKIERVHIIYDNDSAGRIGAEKVKDRLKWLECIDYIPALNDVNDCYMVGMTVEQIFSRKETE